MLDLSILVPVYNAQEYLKRCISSLQRQTISDYEIILVDDGSTDASGEICDFYAETDSRIKVIHQENKGLAGARVAGIKKSSGKFIGFVDSDDYVDETVFEKLLLPMRTCDQIDISIGGHVIDEVDGEINYPCSASNTQIWDDGIEAMTEMFKGEKFVWSLCDKIYNRKLFSAECLDHWPCSHGEDTYINSIVMPKAKKIIFQPIYGYHYCMHPDSMMHLNFTPAKLDTVYIVMDIMDKYNDYSNLVYILHKLLFMYMKEYLKEMQRIAPRYYDDFRKCQDIAKKWLKNNKNNRIENEIIAALALNYDEFKKWKKLEREKLESFCYNAADKLYIYGTGIYGKRTVEYLNEKGIDFNGFIESKPKIEKIMNHPIYTIDNIEREANILLGVGLENTITIKNKLENNFSNIYFMYTFFTCVDN